MCDKYAQVQLPSDNAPTSFPWCSNILVLGAGKPTTISMTSPEDLLLKWAVRTQRNSSPTTDRVSAYCYKSVTLE